MFLCTQGVSTAEGVAEKCVYQASFAVAALLATVATALLYRAWSHVVKIYERCIQLIRYDVYVEISFAASFKKERKK